MLSKSTKQMVQISTGPNKVVVGYLSFDERGSGVFNCKLNGVWTEFPENEVEFEPVVHNNKSRGDA